MWPLRAPGLLIVAGPHAIPISTAVRAGDRRLILGLARRRETLERLRADPYGQAVVVREKLEDMPNLSAVELRVDRVQDHLADGRTEMLDQARWRWKSDEAREVDNTVVTEIEALARS